MSPTFLIKQAASLHNICTSTSYSELGAQTPPQFSKRDSPLVGDFPRTAMRETHNNFNTQNSEKAKQLYLYFRKNVNKHMDRDVFFSGFSAFWFFQVH